MGPMSRRATARKICQALLYSLSAWLCASIHAQASRADESSIVPLSYEVVKIQLESRLTGPEASLRFSRDGVNHSESGERGAYPFLHPLEGQEFSLLRGFGMVNDEVWKKEFFHPGIDFAAAEGSPVLAAASGRVSRSGYTAGYGLFLMLDHGSFSTLYSHLRKDLAVKRGQSVKVGQRIGSVGSTGMTTGPLLHYEIRLSKSKNGKLYAVNPADFLDLASKAGPKGSAATLAFGADVVLPSLTRKAGTFTLSYPVEEGPLQESGPASAFPLLHPLGKGNHIVDTGFGPRLNPFTKKREFHTGIDIVSRWGARVYASGSGSIAKIGYESGYGNYMIIRHGKLVSLYSHLKDTSGFKVGQKVNAGDCIGQIGNTGATTGPHLHFEIRLVTDIDSGFKEAVKQLCDPALFLSWGAEGSGD